MIQNKIQAKKNISGKKKTNFLFESLLWIGFRAFGFLCLSVKPKDFISGLIFFILFVFFFVVSFTI